MYALFFNEDKAQPSPRPKERQFEMSHLFDGRMESMDSAYHREFFQIRFAERFDAVSQQVLSPTFGPALKTLQMLLRTLKDAYTHSERDYPRIDDSPKKLLIWNGWVLSSMPMIELEHVNKTRAQDFIFSSFFLILIFDKV